MEQVYKTDTLTQHGQTFRIEWVADYDSGLPWENEDGHGPVTGWENRDKLPGEMILNTDHGSKRFYDFAAAVKQAKAEGWNVAPYEWKTKGEQAHAAAMADYENLRRFCNDEWHYCGIVVTLLDENEEATEFSASIWGVEDDGINTDAYHASIIQDLIVDVNYQASRAQFPPAHYGI